MMWNSSLSMFSIIRTHFLISQFLLNIINYTSSRNISPLPDKLSVAVGEQLLFSKCAF